MEIRVLHTADCENWPKAIEAVREALHKAGIEAEPKDVVVSTQEEAERMHFIGSPTVQIDGVDAEPAARTRTDFGLG